MFDKAVAEGPEFEAIYSSALNLSSSNWGGNAKSRRHIIETAERYNPNAVGVERMREHHAADFERPTSRKPMSELERYFWEFYAHPDFLRNAIIIVFLLLWLAYSIGSWAGRRKAASDYEFEQELDQSGYGSDTNRTDFR